MHYIMINAKPENREAIIRATTGELGQYGRPAQLRIPSWANISPADVERMQRLRQGPAPSA